MSSSRKIRDTLVRFHDQTFHPKDVAYAMTPIPTRKLSCHIRAELYRLAHKSKVLAHSPYAGYSIIDPAPQRPENYIPLDEIRPYYRKFRPIMEGLDGIARWYPEDLTFDKLTDNLIKNQDLPCNVAQYLVAFYLSALEKLKQRRRKQTMIPPDENSLIRSSPVTPIINRVADVLREYAAQAGEFTREDAARAVRQRAPDIDGRSVRALTRRRLTLMAEKGELQALPGGRYTAVSFL